MKPTDKQIEAVAKKMFRVFASEACWRWEYETLHGMERWRTLSRWHLEQIAALRESFKRKAGK